ncbi:hypothetical protein ACGYQ5_14390 [Burkholderia pseudomallei]
MERDIQRVDRFEPDWESECLICGQKPTVTAVTSGNVAYETGMCGPCTWGEADMSDPTKWNE